MFLLLTLTLSTSVFAQSRDEIAVRNVAMQQAAAWNEHDAAAYSALFTTDCDVVTVPGWWWKSRAEMQQKLTRMFATAFRNSTLTFTDVSVKFLTPDIAIAHARWTMTGEQIPPGQPVPDKGIQTLVMTKHAGKWLIAEFQNTVSKAEPPFLAKPVSTPGAASSTSR
ncbi:MAG: SgcJ/EcaC family oxidoreductase [Rhodanobacteraceae bacterium]